MTRQAISPRFAIRIRLNICWLICNLWAGDRTAIWHAGTDVTIPSYSKTNRRQRVIVQKIAFYDARGFQERHPEAAQLSNCEHTEPAWSSNPCGVAQIGCAPAFSNSSLTAVTVEDPTAVMPLFLAPIMSWLRSPIIMACDGSARDSSHNPTCARKGLKQHEMWDRCDHDLFSSQVQHHR